MTHLRAATPATPQKATEEALDALTAQLRHSMSAAKIRLDKTGATAWLAELLCLLFPQSSQSWSASAGEVRAALGVSAVELRTLLRGLAYDFDAAAHITAAFFGELPEIHRQTRADAAAIEQGDPAAQSLEEVILAYPGFLAIATHRLAHRFWRLEVPLLPRVLSEWAHERTGIDIHPGAIIGHPFVIDHGTGVVIGETAIIGDRVKIYQGVTIGALSVDKSLANHKRHPTIEDEVVIYANATILGGKTVIGAGSVVGGNVWLTTSVPPGSVVSARSEVRVRAGAPDFEVPDFVI